MNPGFNELRNQVIDRGLCTMCGTCIGICPQEALALVYDNEEPSPELRGECTPCGLCYNACPGSDVPLPELERFCFGMLREDNPDDLGIFTYSGMACATDDKVHRAGAGGGVATALLVYGLENGLIDCALVAGFSRDKPWRTEAKIATTAEELIEAAQSKYAAVAVNSLLHEAVKRGYQNIGIIGCPCHIHALRKMEYQRLAPNITNKIKILLGLFCGSQFHFEGTRHVLVEKCDVPDLKDIVRLQYRGRGSEWSSNFIVELDNGEKKYVSKFDMVFGGLINFKRDRCAMCIDWSADLADISLADYWGPLTKREVESIYSSLLIRTSRGDDWCRGAQKAGYIDVKESSADYLVKSLGFETKKHGCVFILEQRRRHGWPTPDFHCHPSYAPYRPKT